MGSNLAAKALAEKYQLVILDNLSRVGSEKNLEWLKGLGEFTFLNFDIRKSEDVEKTVLKHQPEVVFHLAGQVAMTTSLSDPRTDFEINALGSLNLLEAVRKHCPRAFVVYSSTNKVYGDLEWIKYQEGEKRYTAPDYPKGLAENIPLSFSSPYGCSKGSADQYMLDYYTMFGVKTAVLRHSSMYGGRQFATADQGWLGWFCSQALSAKPFTISGNGKQVRDLLYADDMVSLYYTLVKHAEAVKGQEFNIGGGMENSLSLLELFDFLENELKVKLNYTKLPARVSDQKIFVADLTKIKNLTGWGPKVTKEQGIKKMLEWVKQ